MSQNSTNKKDYILSGLKKKKHREQERPFVTKEKIDGLKKPKGV